eukprot:Rmarinus@m.856
MGPAVGDPGLGASTEAIRESLVQGTRLVLVDEARAGVSHGVGDFVRHDTEVALDVLEHTTVDEEDHLVVGIRDPGGVVAKALLVSRLKLGGSLVIPIDEELHVITRKLDGCGCTDRVESGVRFVPLTSLKRQLGDDDE